MKIYLLPALLILMTNIKAQSYIADYNVAKEDILRSIPQQYIDKARNNFKIAYQHTSHGTHVSFGLYGLPNYKNGDEQLFAISRNMNVDDHLAFYDYALESYGEPGVDATDLSRDETAFIQTTRNFLDDPNNSEINVVMWAWCDIAGHQVETNYLPGMEMLIDEYGIRGTKIGSGAGQRIRPVHFIFMTGHANVNDNIGTGKPKNQADLITDYCNKNSYYCLDYFSIDSHCMNDYYYSDCSDDGDSDEYGGNYYKTFQDQGQLGQTYYENKNIPQGDIKFGQHNTQHITANRKAYAMWWILARLAGWDNAPTAARYNMDDDLFYFNQTNKQIYFTDNSYIKNSNCCIYSITGSLVLEKTIHSSALSLRTLKNGLYIVTLITTHGSITKKIVIQH